MENITDLKNLKSNWQFPASVVEKVFDYFKSYDQASEYLEIMDGNVETDKPEDAWEFYCSVHLIEHEIENNPFSK